jgi:hypothetical protein
MERIVTEDAQSSLDTRSLAGSDSRYWMSDSISAHRLSSAATGDAKYLGNSDANECDESSPTSGEP